MRALVVPRTIESSTITTRFPETALATAFVCKDEVIPAMSKLRGYVDKAETLTAAEYWAIPTYGELLFGVR